MKKMLVMMLMFVGFTAFSQEKGKIQTVVIQTSAQCEDCKERIESKLNYTKGIKYAELNLENKKVEVKFDSTKIQLDEIKTIINEIGYDADDFKASTENIEELPKCCQPDGMEKR